MEESNENSNDRSITSIFDHEINPFIRNLNPFSNSRDFIGISETVENNVFHNPFQANRTHRRRLGTRPTHNFLISQTSNQYPTTNLRNSYLRRRRYRTLESSLLSDELEEPAFEESPKSVVEQFFYREYPLPVDWKEVENSYSEASYVLESYGVFGLAIFTSFRNIGESLSLVNCGNLPNKIFEKYIRYLQLSSAVELKAYVDFLPSPRKMQLIVAKRMFSQNELLMIHIVFLLLEIYYSKYERPFFKVYSKIILPTLLEFYSLLSDEQIKALNNTKNENFGLKKEICELEAYLSNKLPNFSKAKEYYEFYSKKKENATREYGGIRKSSFII